MLKNTVDSRIYVLKVPAT